MLGEVYFPHPPGPDLVPEVILIKLAGITRLDPHRTREMGAVARQHCDGHQQEKAFPNPLKSRHRSRHTEHLGMGQKKQNLRHNRTDGDHGD